MRHSDAVLVLSRDVRTEHCWVSPTNPAPRQSTCTSARCETNDQPQEHEPADAGDGGVRDEQTVSSVVMNPSPSVVSAKVSPGVTVGLVAGNLVVALIALRGLPLRIQCAA